MTGHVNDHKLSALQSLLSISGGNIDDLEQAWLISEASAYGHVNDMWLNVFLANGASSDNFNTAASEFLIASGFSGGYNQMWHDYWESGGGIISDFLVFDTFTDTDGTFIDDHTPDIHPVGAFWADDTPGANHIQINAVTVVNSQQGSGHNVTLNAGESDVKITNDTFIGANAGGAYNVFRFQTATSFWFAGPAPFLNENVIFELNVGFTKRAGTAITISSGVTYEVEAIADGTAISSTIDGGALAQYTSSFNLTETRHGFWIEENTHHIDNYRIKLP